MRRSYREARKLLDLSDDELFLFDRLAERETPNPKHDREGNGLKGRGSREASRPIWTAEVSTTVSPVTGGWSADALFVSDGRMVRVASLLGTPEAISQSLLSALAPVEEGALVVFEHGARRDFHLFLLSVGSALAIQGYRLYPMAAHSEVRALVITLGKRSWWLCDAEVVQGTAPSWTEGPPGDGSRPEKARERRLTRGYLELDRLQVLARERLGVALHPTIGATAVAAARQTLPEGLIWWKPPSLLREACLRGGAYRGGWQYAVPYRGEAWKVDITRSYTWALSLPLPARVAFGGAYEGNEECPGIFLTRVEGHSEFPVPLAIWDGDIGEFRKQYVTSYRGLTFLPQTEYAALRACGYEVRPTWGWRFTQLLSLRGLTDRLASIAHDYPRGSLFSQFAKGVGNSLCGKLGHGVLQDEVCYAGERPEVGWWPFITPDGEVIPYLWARPARVHHAYQHADSAAVITSRVRSKTLMFAREWQARYGQVVYADTDGLLVAGRLRPALSGGSDVPGEWRLVGHDADAIVAGKKRYTWQGVEHPLIPTGLGSSAPVVSRAAGQLMVEGKVMGRPWARHPRGIILPPDN